MWRWIKSLFGRKSRRIRQLEWMCKKSESINNDLWERMDVLIAGIWNAKDAIGILQGTGVSGDTLIWDNEEEHLMKEPIRDVDRLIDIIKNLP